ncbi:MAG: hypothetical protein ACOCXZ_00615 [Chloroflexota bacterium]
MRAASTWRRGLLVLTAALPLLLAAFGLHIIDLGSTPPGINYDSGYNVAHAVLMRDGEPLPPLLFDDRPEPAHRYLLAGWFHLLPPLPFTALLLHGFIGLLTVALAYRAGWLLARQGGRTVPGRAGAGVVAGLIAGGAVAAAMPHLFLSRGTYRAVLLPPLLLAALVALLAGLRAPGRRGPFIAAGAFSGAALNVYFAGIIAPVWLAGALLVAMIVPPRGQRLRLRHARAALLGFLPFGAVWLFTMTFIADPFFRLRGAGAQTAVAYQGGPFDRLLEAFSAFYADAFHWMTLYNVPGTPFLNPALAGLALLGLVVALARWYRVSGVMLVGGALGFILPGAFSELPTHPVRLIGALPFVALLAAVGALGIYRLALTLVRAPARRYLAPLLTAAALFISAGSIAATHTRYHDFWTYDAAAARWSPADDWRSIPHNYSLPLVAAMQALHALDQPAYVPLNALDDRIATIILQGGRYHTVTTAARYPLAELPEGVVFYPARDYLSIPTPDQYPLQALLLPDAGTIVILPASTGPLVKQGEGTRPLDDPRYGWTVAYLTPRPAGPVPGYPPPRPDAATLDGALYPLTPRQVTPLLAGGPQPLVVEWRVESGFGRGLFTFVQLLDSARGLLAGDDRQALPFLYPSTRWQPGDVVPTLHTLWIPPEPPQAAYHWTLGAWASPPGQDRLAAQTPDGVYLDDRLYWGAARAQADPAAVNVPLSDDAIPLDARLGETVRLEGYTLDRRGGTLDLTLYWRALDAMPQDYTLFVHVMQGESIIAQRDAPPTLPTWAWFPGELVPTRYSFTLPPDAEPEAIYAGAYSFPGPTRAPVVQGGVAQPDGRARVWPE